LQQAYWPDLPWWSCILSDEVGGKTKCIICTITWKFWRMLVKIQAESEELH